MIPLFIAVFAALRPVPGGRPAHLDQCLLRSPQHPARPDHQRLPLRHRGLCRPTRTTHRRVTERGQDRLDVPGGHGHRSAGPGGLLRAHRPALRRARSRSSWSGPASWPRPWPATCGPTPSVQLRGVRRRQPARAAATCSGELEDLPVLCRQLPRGAGGGLLLADPSGAHHRDAEGLAGQVGVSIVPRYYELITGRSHVEDLSGLPMLDIAPAVAQRRVPGSSSVPSTSWCRRRSCWRLSPVLRW